MNKTIFTLVFTMFMSLAFAQNCKVKMRTINKEYTGNCKKGKADGTGEAKGLDSYVGEFKNGFPHGKGEYTWSKENKTYEGFWIKGKMHGKGVMTDNTNREVIEGYWEKGKYVGLFEKPYKIIDKSSNISGTSIRSEQEEVKSVRLYVKENSKYVINPTFNFIVKEGDYQTSRTFRNFIELTNVSFPLKLLIKYQTKNTNGRNTRESINIELWQPAMWYITLEIDNINGVIEEIDKL